MRKIIIILFIIIALHLPMLTLALQTFYVSQQFGNNNTGNGSASSPYKTITKAVTSSVPTSGNPVRINVDSQLYTIYHEKITLKDYQSVYGGYKFTPPSTWSAQNSPVYRTEIKGLGTGSGSVITLGHQSTVDGFIISNGDFGIEGINNASSSVTPRIFTISNNIIKSQASAGIYLYSYSNYYYGLNCRIMATVQNNLILNYNLGIKMYDKNNYYSSSLDSVTIENNTIVDNTGSGIDGIHKFYCTYFIYYPYNHCCTGKIGTTIRNNILWDDGANHEIVNSSNHTVTYNIVKGGFTGTGNLSSDPLFIPGSAFFHFQTTSPAKNSGNGSADLDSTVRDRGFGGGLIAEWFDRDFDGMADTWETNYGLNQYNPADASTDLDSDNATNFQEYNLGTNPSNMDTDGDMMPDGWEAGYSCVNPLAADSLANPDSDLCNNYSEYIRATNPCINDCSNCGNEICDPVENRINCPQDCHSCGDGYCDGPYETKVNCLIDCHVCPDDICDSPEENRTNCAADCHICGDTYCDTPYEDYLNCSEDCLIPTCIDNDGDGRGTDCSLGADCNDTNPNTWDTCDTCNDNDGDGWYGVCNVYNGINGPDCNDKSIAHWNCPASVENGECRRQNSYKYKEAG